MRHSGIRSQNHLGSRGNVGLTCDYRAPRSRRKGEVGTFVTGKTVGQSGGRLRLLAFSIEE